MYCTTCLQSSEPILPPAPEISTICPSIISAIFSISSRTGSRPSKSSISTSRILDRFTFPLTISEIPGIIFVVRPSFLHWLVMFRIVSPETVDIVIIACLILCSWIILSSLFVVPSTLISLIVFPTFLSSSSMNPITFIPSFGWCSISLETMTPAWPAPISRVGIPFLCSLSAIILLSKLAVTLTIRSLCIRLNTRIPVRPINAISDSMMITLIGIMT